MQTISYVIAGLLGLIGLIFIMGAAQGNASVRMIIGLALLGAAAFFIYLARSKPPKMEIHHEIDLTGDVSVQKLKCRNCGAELDADSIEMHEGAIFVKCPYCGSTYQLEEEPKW
ncbi:MAG: zinc ribbon domain-containing protein [Armatimonadetes bacterium]|nr:zinc ribbon domain-containing protein [Armatimonadota bacterium]